MWKGRRVLWMGVLLSSLWAAGVQAENVTSQGNPFMTVSPNLSDTAFFGSGGGGWGYNAMTDGDMVTSHDTWQGDIATVNTWLYDAAGLQFPSGISGIQRLEWNVRVFGDGGWFNTIDKPVVVQVTTHPAFGSYELVRDSFPPANDGIWKTVPYWHNYPIDVSGINFSDPGVPPDESGYAFEIDYPGTIYGVRIIGDGGGYADSTGFLGTREIRVFTGDRMTRATGIWPAQDATGVSGGPATLQWNPAQKDGAIDPNVVGHFVYLGTDPNGVRVSGPSALPKTATSLALTLNKDTVYYWHVDELLDDDTIRGGYVYTFQTELTLPIIQEQPKDTIIGKGRDAFFRVVATDPLEGTLSYRWYFDADGVAGGGIALADGSDYQGTANQTLTVVDIDLADGGYYFCEVSNGNLIATRMAYLTVGQLISHWKMDGDPNDAMGNYDGVSMGGPLFETGKVGQAIFMDGVDDYVALPVGFDDFSNGLSLSVWARPTSYGAWARFFDFGNGSSSDNILFARGNTSNQFVMEIYLGSGGGAVWSPGVMENNVWQMLTATVDPAGNVVLYKNGVVVGTGVTNIPAVITRGSNFIGRSNWPQWDAPYAGWMDDLRLYDYALTAQEVADIYLLNAGVESICPRPIEFDLDGDCRFSLTDFAIMAQSWLNCGLYPTCITTIP